MTMFLRQLDVHDTAGEPVLVDGKPVDWELWPVGMYDRASDRVRWSRSNGDYFWLRYERTPLSAINRIENAPSPKAAVNLISIARARPHEGVVKLLEQLLFAAGEGKIRGLVVMATMQDEGSAHWLVGERNPVMTIGQLHRLAHQVQMDADAQMNDIKL